jgi:hypothetical protein
MTRKHFSTLGGFHLPAGRGGDDEKRFLASLEMGIKVRKCCCNNKKSMRVIENTSLCFTVCIALSNRFDNVRQMPTKHYQY